jgi:PhoH-like ATPase
MSKIFVLDTNVLLHDQNAIFNFQENTIVIPITVIQEIDKFKKEKGELGANARSFSRNINRLRKLGSLTNGVPVNDEGGMLKVVMFTSIISNAMSYLDMTVPDNRILATAAYFIADYDTVLVTNDTNLSIIADLYKVPSEEYKHGQVSSEDIYTGVRHLDVTQELIDSIYITLSLPLQHLVDVNPAPNECFVLHSTSNTKHSALVRYNSIFKEYRLLPQDMKTADILPRNSEQQFALDMLKDPTLDLVSIIGKAGSGKTIIALAAAINGVLKTGEYDKILLLKPIMAMDNSNDLGYLPGSMEEKLSPWMASYMDNVSIIMANYVKDNKSSATKRPKNKSDQKAFDDELEKNAGRVDPAQELMALGLLEFGSLEHFRGRSLQRQFIIVDETQNCSINAVKTIVTRAAEGTKVVLLGDISQIDNPYLDSKSNGLSVCVEAFKDQDISGHILFRKSERSRLAEIASDIL